jgi:hypothetical protein
MLTHAYLLTKHRSHYIFSEEMEGSDMNRLLPEYIEWGEGRIIRQFYYLPE